MSIGMKMMIRRRRRKRATRETRTTRKSFMVKLTSARNGTRMRRAPTPIVMVWPPWLSRTSPLLQENLSSRTSTMASILASWQRRVGEKVKPKSSPPIYVSSDEEMDSSDDDDDEDEESLLSDMSKNPATRIKGLLTQI
jgi:hypothetical protein